MVDSCIVIMVIMANKQLHHGYHGISVYIYTYFVIDYNRYYIPLLPMTWVIITWILLDVIFFIIIFTIMMVVNSNDDVICWQNEHIDDVTPSSP